MSEPGHPNAHGGMTQANAVSVDAPREPGEAGPPSVSRRFAVVAHAAGGPVSLNDLAGASGRIDVIVRAINAALLHSHGMRRDVVVDLVLLGGVRDRLVRLKGAQLRKWPADERGMAGHLRKLLAEPLPPTAMWTRHQRGVWHRAGGLAHLLDDWDEHGVTGVWLTHDGPALWAAGASLPSGGAGDEWPAAVREEGRCVGFVLSDHRDFTEPEKELLAARCQPASLGLTILQGHLAIGIVHHMLDCGLPLALHWA